MLLAEELAAEPDIETALDNYVHRRLPRVRWVQEQSRRLGEAFRLPTDERDGALKARGDAMFHDRYAPLVPEP